MPYIDPVARDELSREGANGRDPEGAGELNYAITRLAVDYVERRGGVRYERIAEVIGVLETLKMEIYRRPFVHYEDKKCRQNGDVYPEHWFK